MTNSRAKGKHGELEVVHLFKRWFPDARRGARQSGGGSEGADVMGTPYWIEVKRRKDVTARTWADAWNQAKRDMELACEREIIPDLMDIFVVARSDRQEWQVLADACVLAELGYQGPGGVFQRPEWVDDAKLCLVEWSAFEATLDRHFPIQTDLAKELVA